MKQLKPRFCGSVLIFELGPNSEFHILLFLNFKFKDFSWNIKIRLKMFKKILNNFYVCNWRLVILYVQDFYSHWSWESTLWLCEECVWRANCIDNWLNAMQYIKLWYCNSCICLGKNMHSQWISSHVAQNSLILKKWYKVKLQTKEWVLTSNMYWWEVEREEINIY